jgi:hypothetical protein
VCFQWNTPIYILPWPYVLLFFRTDLFFFPWNKRMEGCPLWKILPCSFIQSHIHGWVQTNMWSVPFVWFLHFTHIIAMFICYLALVQHFSWHEEWRDASWNLHTTHPSFHFMSKYHKSRAFQRSLCTLQIIVKWGTALCTPLESWGTWEKVLTWT